MTEQGAALMCNRAGNFPVGRLFEFLTALGQDVRITGDTPFPVSCVLTITR